MVNGKMNHIYRLFDQDLCSLPLRGVYNIARPVGVVYADRKNIFQQWIIIIALLLHKRKKKIN